MHFQDTNPLPESSKLQILHEISNDGEFKGLLHAALLSREALLKRVVQLAGEKGMKVSVKPNFDMIARFASGKNIGVRPSESEVEQFFQANNLSWNRIEFD